MSIRCWLFGHVEPSAGATKIVDRWGRVRAKRFYCSRCGESIVGKA